MSSHITVIGAGFSGLVAAWSLSRKGFKVSVVEKSPTAGGLIGTKDFDGFKVETAANGLLSSKLVEELFEDCGVPILPAQKVARRRYLWVGGKVTRWPLGIWDSVRALSGIARIGLFRALSSLIPSPAPRAKESLLAWGHRIFGSAFANRLLATGVWGIYAAPAETLSASLVSNRVFQAKHGAGDEIYRNGRLRGTVSAAGGMGQLISGLRQTLEKRGVDFRFTTDGTDHLAQILSTKAETTVVVATSALQAADLLESFSQFAPLVGHLRQIRMLSLISVGIQFAKPAGRRGFGTLFSQDAKVGGVNDGILGALQNSVIFSGRSPVGTSSETWILGGQDHGDRFLNLGDDELLNLALEKRRRILGEAENEVLKFNITRWPNAIPHFGVNLERVQLELNQPLGPVVLFGNYLGEIGLRSILEQAERLPLKLAKGRGE